LEKFAKFPISTRFEKGEPRLLLVAVDVQEATPVVFDSYENEDGTRKSEYGRYGRIKSHRSARNQDNGQPGKIGQMTIVGDLMPLARWIRSGSACWV
jgi:hypothetical protein